jgi:hypothetical protein
MNRKLMLLTFLGRKNKEKTFWEENEGKKVNYEGVRNEYEFRDLVDFSFFLSFQREKFLFSFCFVIGVIFIVVTPLLSAIRESNPYVLLGRKAS